MAQKLNPFSGRQFLDANGDPYSGAQLFVYEAGTSTKYTLTEDSAGASNHANPIILNSRGEPADGGGASQVMWQAEGQDVKLVLAPSTDTDPPVAAISTWDNLSGVNDTTIVTTDEWISGTAPTFVSSTSFSVATDLSSVYHVGRRIKTTNTGGTIYSTITAVAFTTVTTVTVENDSGSLDSGLSAVWYSLLSSNNGSTPGTFNHRTALVKGSDIASAAALTIPNDGNFFDVTGTTTVTSIGTIGGGGPIILHFDGALTFTHHATDLILPEGKNITTAAGDIALMYEYAAGDWRCANYFKASGLPPSLTQHGGEYIKLSDVKAQNTNGGTFTTGARRTRTLNTEDSDTGGHCTLSSNQFTLDAGTYRISASAPAYRVIEHQAYLYNVTDAVDVLIGTTERSTNTDGTTPSVVCGQFTISSSKAFEIQHECGTTFSNTGFGIAANLDSEVYTVVELWKVR